jgi:NAD(P)H dehydrogenase (quinone)
MTSLLVIYASDYGNTEKAAQKIADGVQSVSNCEAVLKKAEEVTEDNCLAADGIIIGTPVHMGSPDARIKTFIDKVFGKVGAVFSTGSGYGNAGGGCELAMLSLLSNFAELGMIIVPLPRNTKGYATGGLQWGSYARSASESMEQVGVNEETLEATWHHGANVARVTRMIAGRNPFLEEVESAD